MASDLCAVRCGKCTGIDWSDHLIICTQNFDGELVIPTKLYCPMANYLGRSVDEPDKMRDIEPEAMEAITMGTGCWFVQCHFCRTKCRADRLEFKDAHWMRTEEWTNASLRMCDVFIARVAQALVDCRVRTGGADGCDHAALLAAQDYKVATCGVVPSDYLKDGTNEGLNNRFEQFRLELNDTHKYSDKDRKNVDQSAIVVAFYQGDTATGSYVQKTSMGAVQTAAYAVGLGYEFTPANVKATIEDGFERTGGPDEPGKFNPIVLEGNDRFAITVPIADGERKSLKSRDLIRDTAALLIDCLRKKQYRGDIMFSGPANGDFTDRIRRFVGEVFIIVQQAYRYDLLSRDELGRKLMKRLRQRAKESSLPF